MAVYFNSSNEAITLGQPAVLDFTPQTDAFSISAYFKTTGNGTIISKAGSTTSSRQYQIFLAVGKVSVYIGGALSQLGVAIVNDGRWHHLVLTVPAAASGAQIYIDGVTDGPTLTIGTATNSSDVLFAARRADDANGGLGYRFIGEIAEVAIYSDVLTPAEVVMLYGGPFPVNRMPLAVNADALVGYWDCIGQDGVAVSVVPDRTIQGNDGIPIGTPDHAALPMAFLGARPLIVQAPPVIVTTFGRCGIRTGGELVGAGIMTGGRM